MTSKESDPLVMFSVMINSVCFNKYLGLYFVGMISKRPERLGVVWRDDKCCLFQQISITMLWQDNIKEIRAACHFWRDDKYCVNQ